MLTGLPNRRAFFARLAHEATGAGGGFALILCDVDNLKEVNGVLAHVFDLD